MRFVYGGKVETRTRVRFANGGKVHLSPLRPLCGGVVTCVVKPKSNPASIIQSTRMARCLTCLVDMTSSSTTHDCGAVRCGTRPMQILS